MNQPPSSFAAEAYRPRIHYTAADTWINDPNGLVHIDGIYHLFFQNNPFGKDWGNMSWGHAVSRDLIHWQDRPIAIPCDQDEQVYSGSAVLDKANTSGLGSPGSSPLVAVYTSAYSQASARHGIQAQSLAFSLDGGETWTKYDGNPVLDRSSPHFRDPKVFRYKGPSGEYWVMAAVEAIDRKVVLYRSDNLKDWTYLSEFTSTSPVVTMWECPDLFPLPVDGDPANTKWVLIVSLNREPGEGGSAVIFFVGDFDGLVFTPDGGPGTANPDQPEWEWLDHGRDYYATVSYNDAPDGRRILIGWMNNSDYSGSVPTTPWRGAMALPREVTLHSHGSRFTLRQRVVEGLEPAGATQTHGLRDVPDGLHPLNLSVGEDPVLIEAVFDAGSSAEFGLVLRQGGREETRVVYDTVREQLVVDRRSSGHGSFGQSFPSKETAPVQLIGGRLALQLYVDVASIEAFAQGGLVTVTEQIFASPSSTGLSLYSANGTAQLISLKFTPLKEAPIARVESAIQGRSASPRTASEDD
ncbi:MULTISPECIES: glycoside hydrolase family 32 protein [Arthrobacter]|uniref:Glycoside hydrolase family 32 protein n=1 Tax=Arthrobacter terricola TaxID=2547396 RepID=A0A4R5K9D2_9MICC|nr:MULTISPECIES: glycoside hydrolase family 32 protein [Arthrobacter]MBT8163282.1 glycoside hydrolase family 32 protein [Arthrobacter sp. GN70]TDF91195.1 glycoside hydrolase family 32 protein [Arthrobacter terricola]